MNCKECKFAEYSDLAGRNICGNPFAGNYMWAVPPLEKCKNFMPKKKTIDWILKNDPNVIREFLAAAVEKNGIKATAQQCNVAVGTVHRWMFGTTPTEPTIRKVVNGLGITETDLQDEEEE